MTDIVSNEAQGFFKSVYEGAIEGDWSDNDSPVKTATQVGLGLLPIVGQMADARDTVAAFKQIRDGRDGAWSNLGFVAAGWIPLAGDLVKAFRKNGIRGTLNQIGDVVQDIRNGWSEIVSMPEARLGDASGIFYAPKTDLNVTGMERGVQGIANRFGDIEIRKGLSSEQVASVLDHEKVHRFFSPMLRYGQDFRANLGLLGYTQSHLLRRVEEGLAEGWARFRAEGLTGFLKGWKFPLEQDYGINPKRLQIEKNILFGLGTTAIGAGLALSDYAGDDEQR